MPRHRQSNPRSALKRFAVLCTVLAGVLCRPAQSATVAELVALARELRADQAAHGELHSRTTRLNWLVFQAQLLPVVEQVQIARTLFASPSMWWPSNINWGQNGRGPVTWLIRLTNENTGLSDWIEQQITSEVPIRMADEQNQTSIYVLMGSALERGDRLYHSTAMDRMMVNYFQLVVRPIHRWPRAQENPILQLPADISQVTERYLDSQLDSLSWVLRAQSGQTRLAREVTSRRELPEGIYLASAIPWTGELRDAVRAILVQPGTQLQDAALRMWLEHETDPASRATVMTTLLTNFSTSRVYLLSQILGRVDVQAISSEERALLRATLGGLSAQERDRLRGIARGRAGFSAIRLSGDRLFAGPPEADGAMSESQYWSLRELTLMRRLEQTQLLNELAAQASVIGARVQEAQQLWDNALAVGRREIQEATWRTWDQQTVDGILEGILNPESRPVQWQGASRAGLAALVAGHQELLQVGPEWLIARESSQQTPVPGGPLSALQTVGAQHDAAAYVARMGGHRVHPVTRPRLEQRRFNQRTLSEEGSHPPELSERELLRRRFVALLRQWLRIGLILRVHLPGPTPNEPRVITQNDLEGFDFRDTTRPGTSELIFRGRVAQLTAKPIGDSMFGALRDPAPLLSGLSCVTAAELFIPWLLSWAHAHALAGTRPDQQREFALRLALAEEKKALLNRADPTAETIVYLLKDKMGAEALSARFAAQPVSSFATSLPRNAGASFVSENTSDETNRGISEPPLGPERSRRRRQTRTRLPVDIVPALTAPVPEPLDESRTRLEASQRAIQSEALAALYSNRRPFEMTEIQIPAYRRLVETTTGLIRIMLDLEAHPAQWHAKLAELQHDLNFRGVFSRWPTSIVDFRSQLATWLNRMRADPGRFHASPAIEDAWNEMHDHLKMNCALDKIEDAIAILPSS